MEFELIGQHTKCLKDKYPIIFENFGYIEMILKDRYGLDEPHYTITVKSLDDLKLISEISGCELKIDFRLNEITILD